MALLAVAGWFAFALLRPKPTVLEGRPLEDWLADYTPNSAGERSDSAVQAIRRAGTGALPGLIRIMEQDAQTAVRLRVFAQKWLPFAPKLPQTDLHWKATLAFGILGSNAIPAVEALGRLLDEGRNYGYASTALSLIGAQALPALTNAMSNPTPLIRAAAINATGRMGANAISAVPVVRHALQDSSPIVASAATNALLMLEAAAPAPAGEERRTLSELNPN